MSINRVQKLLYSEYSDFEDMVLIESPFAQTTKQGRGIRQVYLGLTPTKLVLATDIIPPVEKSYAYCTPSIDPDIETFELIAIYPVECVNLSVFSKQKRQALKAHFCNNSVLYFELGGFEKRKMFWNLWLERIKFLTPDDNNSSKSETSVASASTTSTLYLIDSKNVVKKNGEKQIWCTYGTGNSQSSLLQKWNDRYLYLGKSFEDLPAHYMPHVRKPTLKEFVQKASLTRNKTSPSASGSSQHPLSPNTSIAVNRFGNGINDNCSTTLLMPAKIEYTIASHLPQQELEILMEACVRFWELNSFCPQMSHKRRYGLCPYPYFLHGLGPWNIPPGCRFSVQVKRAVSAVVIQRQPVESGLTLPISRRQLLATISYDDLNTNRITDRSAAGRMPVILFWTPYYWYRPRTAKYAYDELRNHLSSIREWQERKQHRRKLRKLCWRKTFREDSETGSDIDMDSLNTRVSSKAVRFRKAYARKQNVAFCKLKRETPLQKLKRCLKMDLILTAWDFDSTTLAQQLTVIDKELLLRVTNVELGVIIWQQSAKNAPNISAIIAFAHRISCLVANEILREESEQIRARLIARFINVAYKCHHISNYQSCRTILAGLQSLAIFRLRLTWTYVRKKHATTYKTFEYLCKLYRDIRLPVYQKSFSIANQGAPYLPQVADILGRLLDRVPNYRLQSFTNILPITSLNKEEVQTKRSVSTSLENNNFSVGSLISSIKYLLMPTKNIEMQRRNVCCGMKDEPKKYNRSVPLTFKALHNRFKPLEFYEDNKIKCLQETTKFLQCCQLAAMSYCFSKNELATNYLLKARYREDKENFYISLSIEPPIYCDKYLNKKH